MKGLLKRYLQQGIIKKDCNKVEQCTFLDFKDVRSMCFVYYIESEKDLNDLESALNVLDGTNIPYLCLVIEGQKRVFSKMDFNSDKLKDKLFLLKNKDLNWLGIPKDNVLNDFFYEKMDMLICCGPTDVFTLEYICRKVDCRFKVGRDAYVKGLFSFILQTPHDKELTTADFLKELFKYLRIIKNKDLE